MPVRIYLQNSRAGLRFWCEKIWGDTDSGSCFRMNRGHARNTIAHSVIDGAKLYAPDLALASLGSLIDTAVSRQRTSPIALIAVLPLLCALPCQDDEMTSVQLVRATPTSIRKVKATGSGMLHFFHYSGPMCPRCAPPIFASALIGQGRVPHTFLGTLITSQMKTRSGNWDNHRGICFEPPLVNPASWKTRDCATLQTR